MTRTFVAVSPPGDVVDAVAAHVATTAVPAARLTTRDQWHFTLAFLGNHADIDAVASALTPLRTAAGPVRIGGGGAFPNERRGRVLWLGVAIGGDLLTRLAAEVGAALVPLGHGLPERPYHPHLTLARYKTPTDLRGAIDALGREPIGAEWIADAVAVYESELRNDGARHTRRATIMLPR